MNHTPKYISRSKVQIKKLYTTELNIILLIWEQPNCSPAKYTLRVSSPHIEIVEIAQSILVNAASPH